jgi:molybdopterin-guanine dinucleotide biosynthesis protein A
MRLGGVAKGLLRLDGAPLITHQLRLATRFDEVLLIANDPAPYRSFGLRAVPDVLPGKGAPGGLHAALWAARSDWVCVIACDMPFVSEAVLDRLLAARGEAVDAVAFEVGGRLEPLPSLWRRSLEAPVRERLQEGNPSLQSLCEVGRLTRLPEALLREVDPHCRSVLSLNRPEDLAAFGVALPEETDP